MTKQYTISQYYSKRSCDKCYATNITRQMVADCHPSIIPKRSRDKCYATNVQKMMSLLSLKMLMSLPPPDGGYHLL